MGEDYNVCAICSVAVWGSIGGVPRYFCPACFEQWQGAIYAKAPWALYLLNAERSRRKRRANRQRAGWVVVSLRYSSLA